jgi:hypothetical protein
MHLNDAHLIILRDNTVVLGIDLYSVLRRPDHDTQTKTYRHEKRHSHSHVVLLCYRDGRKTPAESRRERRYCTLRRRSCQFRLPNGWATRSAEGTIPVTHRGWRKIAITLIDPDFGEQRRKLVLTPDYNNRLRIARDPKAAERLAFLIRPIHTPTRRY